MARWMAIATLMLGLALTAYQSFQEPELRTQPVTQGETVGVVLEGGSGFPSPHP